jgi:hypothetical protein
MRQGEIEEQTIEDESRKERQEARTSGGRVRWRSRQVRMKQGRIKVGEWRKKENIRGSWTKGTRDESQL